MSVFPAKRVLVVTMSSGYGAVDIELRGRRVLLHMCMGARWAVGAAVQDFV